MEYTPKLRRPANGTLSYEKPPTLFWNQGRGRDTLEIYRGAKPRRGFAIARLRLGAGTSFGFSVRSNGYGWRARYERAVAYGVYSWRVIRRDPRTGNERITVPRHFRVGPSPLRNLRVKLRTKKKSSIKRPGSSTVTIRSAPMVKVTLRLRHRGRTISVRSFKEGRNNPKSRITYPWWCSKTGSFKLRVDARDGYGNRRTSTVRWNVSASRCAEMKRKAEARRRAKQERQSGSGGGGGSCTPGYSPCLPPASDYDCAGGSGDGPKYVTGPVYVTGSDPYGLDSDGDGIGCE